MARLSRRLSAYDSVFLEWERPEQPMHVAECMACEGRFTAADVVPMIDERIHLLPRYRQKVVAVPFGLAYPTWETIRTSPWPATSRRARFPQETTGRCRGSAASCTAS